MNFSEDVIITPADLSKDLIKIAKVKLLERVTGICHPKYGYFIKVFAIGDLKNGLIMEGTGDIIFKIDYSAVIMRPFKGEICDGIIDTILEEGGIFVKVGPMKVFIAMNDVQPNFTLDSKNLCYFDEKKNIELKKGTKIRFRYKDIQIAENEFKPVGTMKDDYLGYLQDN